MSIFDEQVSRKPDLYPWTQDLINAMWAGHWTPNEFSFQSDIQQFHTVLTEQEREIVIKTLSAIGQIEIAVKKFWGRLGDNLPHPSLTDLGLVMAGVEVIHNKAYEKLIDVLQLQDVFEKNLQLDIIRGRVNYLRKYLEKNYEDDRQQYLYSIILFTLFVENVSLFSQFYVISWFERFQNVLKDTGQQVSYTRQEENLHAQAGIQIINTIRRELPELFTEELIARIREEAYNAHVAEIKIIDWIVGDYEAENLSAHILSAYVGNRINESLRAIGIPELKFGYDATLIEKTNWMNEELYGNAMTDFFHKRPIDYAKANKSFDVEDLF